MNVLGIYDRRPGFDLALLRDEHYELAITGNKAESFKALLNGGHFETERFHNGYELMHWLYERGIKQLHVCLEERNGREKELAEVLDSYGYLVSVVDPEQVDGYTVSELNRGKGDKHAAKMIAHFCANRTPAPWRASAAIRRELKDMKIYLEKLHGWRDQEQYLLDRGGLPDVVRKMTKAHVAFLDEQIKEIQEHINPLLKTV
jgi:transposase